MNALIGRSFIPRDPYLQSIVQVIWQSELRPPANETIIPSGLIELIFDLSADPLQATIDDHSFPGHKCFFNGFNSYPIQLCLPGQLSLFGVTFHAAAIPPLFHLQAVELANNVVDGSCLDQQVNEVWERLYAATSFQQRVTVISGWLEGKAVSLNRRDLALNRFLSHEGDRVPAAVELADHLCYSPRHLSRKMRELTGMNTEEILLYDKYIRSMTLLHETDLSLTEIALTGQFYDQSHFIRSFRRFANLTPSDYRSRKGRLPGHYYVR